MFDALISIKPIYVQKLLSGEKAAELRNRRVNLQPGSRLWIYSTLPSGCLETVAKVSGVQVGAPGAIWEQFGSHLGVSEKNYRRYVNGSNKVSAIFVKRVQELPLSLSLQRLKSQVPGFHPPQFLKYMCESDPVLSAIIDLLLPNSNPDYFKELGLQHSAFSFRGSASECEAGCSAPDLHSNQ